jgi:hypothetical protein
MSREDPDVRERGRELARELQPPPDGGSPPLEILRAVFARSGPDTRIAFGSRRPGKGGEVYTHFLTNIAVRDLDQALPGILEYEVQHTQYVMLNTLRPSVAVEPFQGVPRYYPAKNENVEELNALYVDLDVGREGEEGAAGMPAHIALGILAEEARQRRIPMPSLLALSGRGVYAVWLLRGESLAPGSLPRATADNRRVWRAIAQSLVQRTLRLCSDRAAAVTLARWLKRPGTLDTQKDAEGQETKSGNRVVWWASLGDAGHVPLYTLEALRCELGIVMAEPPPVPALPAPATGTAAPLPATTTDAPRRLRKGGRRKVSEGKGSEPHGVRVREIEALSAHRGGMRKGTRGKTLFFYVACLRAWYRASHPDNRAGAAAHAAKAARELNATFQPPLPEGELHGYLYPKPLPRGEPWRGRFRNDTIARDLRVTAEEVEAVPLGSLVPAEIAEPRDRAELVERQTRAERRKTRQTEIDRRIREGMGPSQIADAVGALMGEAISRQLVDARRKRLELRGGLGRQLDLPRGDGGADGADPGAGE